MSEYSYSKDTFSSMVRQVHNHAFFNSFHRLDC